MLNGRIYNFTYKQNYNKMPIDSLKKKKCLLIIIIIHILKKKNSYYIKILCALHRLPISFSNFQGNFIRNSF